MFSARLILLGSLFPAAVHAGLLAHWKLDSSPADEVASFPAAWEGATSYTTSVAAPASAAAADLAGAWLKAGSGINFEREQAFSACAWIQGAAQDSAVIGDMIEGGDYRGWELHVGSTENGAPGNSVTVWLVSDYPSIGIQVNAGADVLDGQWHHIAFTYDGSSSAAGVTLFIDGVQTATTTTLDTLGGNIANHTVAELNIGTRMNGAAHTFTGGIDEVAVFDHKLSGTEIAAVFQSGVESISHPQVAGTIPAAGQSVAELSSAEVAFSFPVSGVDAADLRVNGLPATAMLALDSKTVYFTFASPPQGDVHFTWAADHGITGLNGVAAQPVGWSVLFVPELPPGQVAIAEFLTKNAGGYEDEDHDTPDWIELVNPGTADVNLDGWALTDDPAKPRRWVLPAITLSPGARKLVFASGKDRRPLTGNLHADFKLASEGGYLALSDPTGAIVHMYDAYPRQEGNVSFGMPAGGMPSDGRAGWRYLTPTPNAAQAGTIYSAAAISEVAFSPAAPVVGDAITVTIRTSPEAVPTSAPTLYYKIMHGSDIGVAFADDGLHGDGAAGDRLWGAVIPAGAGAGQMVRWRVSLSSQSGISRWPINLSSIMPLPRYEGTVIGGNTAGQVLPVYQVFVPNYVFPTSTSQSGIDSTSGGRGAFFGNGKLYDNVLIRTKGTTSASLFKRSHRVDFNPGRDFEWSPDLPAQRELNLNSEYNDPSYLRQQQQLWMHRDSGQSGAPHFPVRLLMNGANWQLAFHTYPADSELVETMGLDPRGAIYKQVGQLSNTYAEKKSRRWESSADLSALVSGLNSSSTARSLYIHDNLNLPAVINYLAVTRIAQESDDVWANMVVYRDSEGTGEWQPIPFDLNLSFGQLFYGFSPPYNTTIEATNDANKSHPLYGSSACLSNTGNIGQFNRLYDAIIRTTVTREMLLRRIRTLTDRYLSTSPETSLIEANFDAMGALIGPDADIDRAYWGLPPNQWAYGLGPGISPAQGLATLKSSFLAPRRTHFYTTHSIHNAAKTLGISNSNKAGIPDAQSAAPVINFGAIEAHPVSGNQDQEYIQLSNPGSAAVDVSDWTLRGSGGSFKLRGGTVIPAGGSLYVSPNVAAFRARTVSPKKNENRLVVGPYAGHLSPYGETLRLENEGGALIALTQVAADPNAPPVELAVTEIFSSSNHVENTINGDWWELTNLSNEPIQLTGFSWDDIRNLPGQAVFPVTTLAAGESAIILDEDDEDEAELFRAAWNLPESVTILTRKNFGLPLGFRGLGNGDAIVLYLPNGTQVARTDYPAHSAGRSRAWFRNGAAIPGDYSQAGQYGAVISNRNPGDTGSPGFAAADPATLTDPYEIWAAGHQLWSIEADPQADADEDGRNNRTEYAFGGSPRMADAAPAQALRPVDGFLEWTFTRRGDDPALSFGLEGSADLIGWSPLSLAPFSVAPHPGLPGFVECTYRITPGSGPLFLRARAD